LTKHPTSALVNADGTTSAAVNASIRAITANCAVELSPTTTTPTTMPVVTVATTTPADHSASCPAAIDVVVAHDALQQLVDPGPTTLEAWSVTIGKRLDLAVVTAPTSAAQAVPSAMSAELDSSTGPITAPRVAALSAMRDDLVEL